jgi:hypothetical protein
MTTGGPAVIKMVDALAALLDVSPVSVGRVLGATLAPGPLSEQFDGVFASGPFEQAHLRYDKELNAGILILEARPDSGLVATNVDLRSFGPPPLPVPSSPTHLGGGEGYYSLSVTLAPGVEITFQFTQQTQRLYQVVVDWSAERAFECQIDIPYQNEDVICDKLRRASPALRWQTGDSSWDKIRVWGQAAGVFVRVYRYEEPGPFDLTVRLRTPEGADAESRYHALRDTVLVALRGTMLDA